MNVTAIRFWKSILVAAVPAAVFAFSTGPPPARNGIPGDGGLNCTVCHRTYAPANSDSRGKLTITTSPYTPGLKQTIRISMTHPEASRWGFQVSARLATDDTKQAGTFTVTNTVQVKCFDNTSAPCNGAREFAEHRRDQGVDGTNPGKTGGVDIDLEWTPPATDVGGIVIYAAGNMANNDGTNNGDRIYLTNLRIDPSCSGATKPSIASVVNGASFQPGIAPNGMVTIFGSGFAPRGSSRGASASDISDGHFPTQLACVAVEIGGERAPITFVNDTQVNAQAPDMSAQGPVEVRVISDPGRPDEARSDPAPQVQVAPYAPAFFTFDGKRAAALTATNDPLTGGRTAKPGDVVVLFGTGFGATSPAVPPGAIADKAAAVQGTLSVVIGGVTLQPEDVIYAGMSPGSISGLYQLNVRIPASVSDGDVPVSASIGGQSTQNGTTIPVKR